MNCTRSRLFNNTFQALYGYSLTFPGHRLSRNRSGGLLRTSTTINPGTTKPKAPPSVKIHRVHVHG